MSFEQFEEDILEILNEDELSAGMVRRKVQTSLRRIEGLWNFPYMFLEDTVNAPVGNTPIEHYGVEWKVIKKVGLWDPTSVDSSLPGHGGGATAFHGFLQKITEEDLKKDHFDTLNVATSWGLPLMYQVQKAGFVTHPIQGDTVDKIYRTQFQLYPPASEIKTLSLIGYAYSVPYTDDNADEDHWILHYGKELLEAWTILSLTPALQDATLAKFYTDLVGSAQSVLLKSEANADWEGLDETAEYVGEGDI